MGLFDKIFGQSKDTTDEPQLLWGRFSDSYKSDEKYDAWDEALELFEDQKYLESIRKFLYYLQDEKTQNLEFKEENGSISFEILQGSKIITGSVNEKKFKAEAKIAGSDSLNIGLMRRLMEQNFVLKYSKYALDKEQNITMVFETYLLDASPYKLYYALKELAINSDKQDDVLIDEFKSLTAINNGHIIEVPQKEKEIKYQFLISNIKAIYDEIENGKLNLRQYPGAASYLYLNLMYKLDYLISPEGFTLETFEKIHHAFFSNDGKVAGHKNNEIKKAYDEILERKKEEFFDELYQTKSTFGVTIPSGHERLTGFIEGEIGNMDWYQKNKHHAVALSIPGYIIGYSLFNYALPAPDRDFLHLYFRIFEDGYFRQLEFKEEYMNGDEINQKLVLTAIESIISRYNKKYPKLKPDLKSLRFDNNIDFARSYIKMLQTLDLTKLERFKKA